VVVERRDGAAVRRARVKDREVDAIVVVVVVDRVIKMFEPGWVFDSL
jgi:hypothetical protein